MIRASNQLGALMAAAPPLLHVYPAPAQSFPDLKTTRLRAAWNALTHTSSDSSTVLVVIVKKPTTSWPVTGTCARLCYYYVDDWYRELLFFC